MTVTDYLGGERAAEAIKRIGKEKNSLKALVLLPIPTKEKIETDGGELLLQDLVEGAEKSTVIVGYGVEKRHISAAEKRGALLVDLSLDECFIRENARLSAEGAIGEIITSAGISLSGAAVGVIGLGRIGSELIRLLYFMGAKITLYTTKSESALFSAIEDYFRKRKTPIEAALLASRIKRISHTGKIERGTLAGLDILINTAPDLLIPSDAADTLAATAVYELASGVNLPSGVEYTRLAAIPSRLYPKEGGILIAEALGRAIAKKCAEA